MFPWDNFLPLHGRNRWQQRSLINFAEAEAEREVKKLTELLQKRKGKQSSLASIGETCFRANKAAGRSYCSSRHAPVLPSRFNNFFPLQVKTGKTAYRAVKTYKKVTHCLFDMDGTIIDSERLYHRILKEICEKHGKKYSKELERKNYGCTNTQICTNVVEDLQLNLSVDNLEKELAVISKYRLPKAPLKKGVEKLLKHLFQSGVLFALATNATRRDVRLHINTKPHIFNMFHHMVCATDPDVDRGKPFPDVYLMAAARFPEKPKPVRCLVFEDSLCGLEAGLAAGMQVVMTPPRSLSRHLCKDATLVLKSLQDFKPELFGLPPFIR